MKQIEKYLIYKKSENKVEYGGTNSELNLISLDNERCLNIVRYYDSYEEVKNEIEKRQNDFEKYNGNYTIYYYDNETKPSDLSILKVTVNIEEL